MRVTVIGIGYVGLVTAVGLAERGHDVVAVDLRDDIVRRLNDGICPIYERGLPELLRKVVREKRFSASVELAPAIGRSELTMVAVGTPSTDEGIDLTSVRSATEEVGDAIGVSAAWHAVVVKSTVLPGTTDSFVRPILESHSGKTLGQFGVGFNPEFLREGSALDDFLNPDRLVLGADDPRSSESLTQLYSGWDCDRMEVSTRTAEMIKYANNCLLATQISAMNDLANLSAAIGGIDMPQVVRGVQLDHRWNPILPDGHRAEPSILSYLEPGCGFGGSCFPKDLLALKRQGEGLGLQMRMLSAVLDVNDDQPLQVVQLLRRAVGNLQGARIAVLGIAFKPGTDDTRLSPALPVLRGLLACGASVAVADPVAALPEEFASHNIERCESWEAAVSDADAVAIMTAWDEYVSLSPQRLIALMKGSAVVDGRGITQKWPRHVGLRVFRIGEAPAAPPLVSA